MIGIPQFTVDVDIFGDIDGIIPNLRSITIDTIDTKVAQQMIFRVDAVAHGTEYLSVCLAKQFGHGLVRIRIDDDRQTA